MICGPESEQNNLEINTINLQKKRLELTKQITWEDFKGKIDENMPWKAHIYWQINYSYFVDIGKTIKVYVKSFCKVCTKKSWVRDPNEKLLRHEQGHYDIGIMCSLYFKKTAKSYRFTAWDYKKEVKKLFEDCLKQYKKIEVTYDNETDHGRNDSKQLSWDSYITKQLIELNQSQ